MRVKAEIKVIIDITEMVEDNNVTFPQAEEMLINEIECSCLDCLGDIIDIKTEIKKQ